jgi:hypothetical protein
MHSKPTAHPHGIFSNRLYVNKRQMPRTNRILKNVVPKIATNLKNRRIAVYRLTNKMLVLLL